MRTFRCPCGNALYFENTQCLSCQRLVRFCPRCRRLTRMQCGGAALVDACGHADCGAPLARCLNDVQHQVCNRAVLIFSAQTPIPGMRCDCCLTNDTIPDLSVAGNHEKWYRLEAAKRRLFYELETLRLPIGQAAGLPLRFDFKADLLPHDGWQSVGEGEQVLTGHADGKITINIREAEDVAREQMRVDLGQAHRTLIGHFRHEIGHYYWQALVRGRAAREQASAAHFGDPDRVPYPEALRRFYQQGPPTGWWESHISAYAAIHPWEDFAETFAFYLDMFSSLETAAHFGITAGLPQGLDEMVQRFREVGLAMNEMNRTMGLVDLLPVVPVAAVVEKLRFVHQLVRESALPTAAACPPVLHPPSA